MHKIAVIGGTGVYDPGMLADVREGSLATPYGKITYKAGVYRGQEVIFIPRHGAGHTIPPHLINYRANIWGLKKLGVNIIMATTAVGSLNLEMKPGEFVLVDQFLDFTKNRQHTFYEGGERGVVHVDVTAPYCGALRAVLARAAVECRLSVHCRGVYVCTEGPRFETPAEIRAFTMLGGDLVGMTNVPEVVLAREAEMCYATISMVTNFAAGISPVPLTHAEVLETMQANTDNLKQLVMKAIDLMETKESCLCGSALKEFGGFKL